MIGTIDTLQELERGIGVRLAANEQSGGRDTEAVAVQTHRRLRSLLSDPDDTVATAILRAHRGGKVLEVSPSDTDISNFLANRYEIHRSGDRLERQSWLQVSVLLAQQLSAARILLKAGGHSPRDKAASQAPVYFVPRSAKGPMERKKERELVADQVAMPYTAKTFSNLGLSGMPVLDRQQIVDALSRMGESLRIAIDPNGEPTKYMKGLMGLKNVELKDTDSGWPNRLQIGDALIELPPQAMKKFPSVYITEFVGNASLSTTAPVRAIERLLGDFPSHIPFTQFQWWAKK
jgi:hypothetical protein